MSNWINIKDELPKEDKPVLFSIDELCFVGVIKMGVYFGFIEPQYCGNFEKEEIGCPIQIIHGKIVGKITHWRTLDAPNQ